MSNLQMRIITAICLVAISLAATWAGGLPFRLLIIAIGAAIYHEWQILTLPCQTRLARGLGWLFYSLITTLLLFDGSPFMVFGSIAISGGILAVLAGQQAAWQAGGLLYALAAPVTLAFLRDEAAGLSAVLFLYAVVWSTDSAAYFAGRALGGPKLAPRISPKKTCSGAIGGLLAALAVGFIMAWLLPDLTMPLEQTLILAFALCVVSQMGDLGESWLKRHFNIKDSGTLLPGHGGFMDRVDGLIAASVTLYLILHFID